MIFRHESGASMDRQQLIDHIYECAFVPELWPSVLKQIANIAESGTGWLFFSNRETHRATCSHEETYSEFSPLIEAGWFTRCERARLLFAINADGFLREKDVWSDEEFAEHQKEIPIYRDILVPRGYGRGAGTVIQLPTEDRLWLSVERKMARGPIEDEQIGILNDLRPHLARSAYMSARLLLERARSAVETLRCLRLPAFVIASNGRVLATNDLMENSSGVIRWRANDQMSLYDSVADKQLRAAVAGIHSDNACVRSFPVRTDSDKMTIVAHITPVRLSSRQIFQQSTAVVVLMPVAVPQAPPVDLVQSLFDLTPMEARVARRLVAGKRVDNIAAEDGLSINTIRTHVRRILEKTGCARQTDIIALLTDIGSRTPVE